MKFFAVLKKLLYISCKMLFENKIKKLEMNGEGSKMIRHSVPFWRNLVHLSWYRWGSPIGTLDSRSYNATTSTSTANPHRPNFELEFHHVYRKWFMVNSISRDSSSRLRANFISNKTKNKNRNKSFKDKWASDQICYKCVMNAKINIIKL